jgi:hypothetical protein
MKKYEKPSLKKLGLLRLVTKVSGCPAGTANVNGGCFICWIAAVVFEEDIFTGIRVNLVRSWLIHEFEPSGLVAKLIVGLYRTYGERVANVVKKSSILKCTFRKLFDKALAKAEAKYGTL